MNKLIIIFSALVVAIASSSLVTADNVGNEVMPMLYLKIPIGSKHSMHRDAEYGAAFGIVETSPNASGLDGINRIRDTDRPRLLDLRFKQDGFESLEMNGVSLVQKIVKVNADGSTSEDAGLADLTTAQWILIGLGVGGVLCATDVICDDDNGSAAPPVPDDVMADAMF